MAYFTGGAIGLTTSGLCLSTIQMPSPCKSAGTPARGVSLMAKRQTHAGAQMHPPSMANPARPHPLSCAFASAGILGIQTRSGSLAAAPQARARAFPFSRPLVVPLRRTCVFPQSHPLSRRGVGPALAWHVRVRAQSGPPVAAGASSSALGTVRLRQRCLEHPFALGRPTLQRRVAHTPRRPHALLRLPLKGPSLDGHSRPRTRPRPCPASSPAQGSNASSFAVAAPSAVLASSMEATFLWPTVLVFRTATCSHVLRLLLRFSPCLSHCAVALDR